MINIAAWILILTGLALSCLGTARVEELSLLMEDPLFLLGFFLILTAIFFRRMFAGGKKNEGGRTGSIDLGGLAAKIETVIEALQKLLNNRDQVSLKDIHDQIETLQKDPIFDVAEAKDAIIGLSGYGPYGDFMSDFATGERFIARSWSAAVDGYDGEAFDYIAKAIPFFQKAQTQFQAILSKQK